MTAGPQPEVRDWSVIVGGLSEPGGPRLRLVFGGELPVGFGEAKKGKRTLKGGSIGGITLYSGICHAVVYSRLYSWFQGG